MENKINGCEVFRKTFGLLLFLATTACEMEGFEAASLENIPPGPVVQKGAEMSDEEKVAIREIQQELIMVQEELALKNRAITEGQVKLVQLQDKFSCIQDYFVATQKGIDCSGFEGNRNAMGYVNVPPEELEKLVKELEETRKQLNQEVSRKF